MIIGDDELPHPLPHEMAARASWRLLQERYMMAKVQENLRIVMNQFAPFVSTQPVYQKLLGDARQAIDNGNSEMAVVLSHAGAELCTEAAISTLLTRRAIAQLFEPLMDLFLATDICNERLRAIYVALSGDEIQQAPFWTRLKNSRQRRNAIVHEGATCSAEEARESVETVEQFIAQVQSVVNLQSA